MLVLDQWFNCLRTGISVALFSPPSFMAEDYCSSSDHFGACDRGEGRGALVVPITLIREAKVFPEVPCSKLCPPATLAARESETVSIYSFSRFFSGDRYRG